MTHRPIFFDPSGKRRRWSLRSLILTLLVIVGAAVAFATTIVDVPAGTPLPLAMERPQALPLGAQVARVDHRVRHAIRQWLPRGSAGTVGRPLTVGFYVPWDDASFTSLQAHMGELDWVVPALATVAGPQHQLQVTHDRRFAYAIATAPRRPHVLTMVQNLTDGNWDGAGAAQLMRSPAARTKLISDIAAMLATQHAAGVVFDFESLPANALENYRKLLAEAHKTLGARGLRVTATVPADDQWPLAAIAAACDRVFLMNYDEHWQGGTAGPIASQPWFVDRLRDALRQIPRDKMIVALASYAYDWHGKSVDALTIEEALLAAHDSGTVPGFDPESGNSMFAYEDEGEQHMVWMVDAAATWNQLVAARAAGVTSVALWRLGSEDPGVWTDFATWRGGSGRPDLSRLVAATDVDVEGRGEILRISDAPKPGARTLTFGADNLVRGVRYDVLPTPYVVQRTGGQDPKKLALTFDDGPDPEWTPRILDILKSRHVPATFFVIGENAVEHPELLRRIVAEGHEVGNHSYTHPNMAEVAPSGVRLELNATQRLIEAYTGHSTRLFRAPYFGDAEPTTADEIDPAMIAQEQGYTVVGLHVDTEDWTRPGVDAILRNAFTDLTQVGPDRSENVVLLHDGGGNRAQTVAALPILIDRLRAQGYRFVPVSQLAGLSREDVMPRIAGRDLMEVRVDVGIFLILADIEWGLRWLFFLAIGLGMGRAVLMTILALTGRKRYRAPPMPTDPPHVSVIIPAYNEARVIEASVHRVLESTGVTLEVIVADDGSKDETSAIVAQAFAGDPRVRLLTLANGGKAAALNRALKEATAPIIVALDADTQFEPETIARLARWFADPDIGAVAGNAKVGNRINLVTRWQAVEYVTAQNIERRALARFDAMMVVPGAVGAWRREALDDVGGYPEDTLAEDQDLTIAIQRDGWQVAYDVEAVAWTEAPESFRALAKQRFRWAFGTLQCLWKHRGMLWTQRPAGLALVGWPQTLLFQVVFAAISPLIDLALLLSIIGTIVRVHQHGWAQTQTDVIQMAIYWTLFTLVDLACGWVAFRMEKREKRFPGLLLLAQRFIYRQVMYWVVIRAIGSAIAGFWVGWGKLERSGRVSTAKA